MPAEVNMVSLGFTEQTFPAGVHICQIYCEDSERSDAQLKFLQSGLTAGERTSCFSEKLDEAKLSENLAQSGLSYAKYKASGAFSQSDIESAYFHNSCFDPDHMLGILQQYYADSIAKGYPAARIIGEMTADIQHIPGGNRLLEYESRVSLLLQNHPVTCVCQYDANAFDGATILQILKVHPMMIIRGTVIYNPFFVEPEDFLSKHCQQNHI